MSQNTNRDRILAPPWPDDPEIYARWEEERRRRRMLEGVWRQDLETQMIIDVGSQRANIWGRPSLTRNPLKNISKQLSVLYDGQPAVSHDKVDVTSLAEAVEKSGLWGAMQRFQMLTVGIREYFMRIDASKNQRLSYRAVPPDYVISKALISSPSVPVAVDEYRLREELPVVEGKPPQMVWTIDRLDVSDLKNPIYKVLSADGKNDLTELYIGESVSGEDYPYRTAKGIPVLPYVLYHAQQLTDRTYDPYEWIELVDGTLDVAVDYQLLRHSFREASWPQRGTVNLEPIGADTITQDGQSRQTMTTDPTFILQLRQIADTEGEPKTFQWDPGADVAMLHETLANMTAELAQDAGVPPSDIQRLGGTARSGAAISLTNEGKRKAQKHFAPAFKVSDQRLLTTSAILLNRAGDALGADRKIAPMPEGGYRIAYTEIPLSPEERTARREDVLERLAAGMITKLTAYMTLNPELSKAQAIADLAAMKTTAKEANDDTNPSA